MIEIDQLWASYNPKKNNYTIQYAFFFTSQRSDEILEVGAIYPGYEFTLN